MATISSSVSGPRISDPASSEAQGPNSDLDSEAPFPSAISTPEPLLRSATKTYIDPAAMARAPIQDDDITEAAAGVFELSLVISNRGRRSSTVTHPPTDVGLAEEAGTPTAPISQGRPPEMKNLLAEIIFVLVCTSGQVVFSLTLGHITVVQSQLRDTLGIPATQVPWLIGASLLASGLSVIVAGPFADLAPPKPLMVGAFIWQALWNAVSAGTVRPKLKILFFVARAMQGLSVGILVSASMSILGRIYNPGIRKTRVFSLMAAGAPLGFWIGCVQGGALSAKLPWVFASTSIFLALCAVAGQLTIPHLTPARDSEAADVPTLRQFDYLGALIASVSCGLLIFGLTQGPSAKWNPYSYSLIIVGVLLLVGFYFLENRVRRPLIPNRLWKTPGFAPLMISLTLGYGAYSGAWQFYAIQFWQRYQHASPLTTALYIMPNAIIGVLATFIVSKTLHVFPIHWILTASMVCFAMGPIFFLPQSPTTSYWALSMPGVALATLGPDLSFAAAAIFITSSVPRSYQGSAGSLLVTVENLTAAIFTSVSDSLGVKVDSLPSGEISLEGIRAIWWFGLGSALAGAIITAACVRIPKAEEKEHVH